MASTAAEITFKQVMRGVDGQAQELATIRSTVSIVLSAGGLAAAFLGARGDGHGWAFWVAVAAFALIAMLTIVVYWPVNWFYDFDGYELVNEYVDADPPWEPE